MSFRNASKRAMQLTNVGRESLLKFEPGVGYGPTLPRGVSCQIKPRLALLGLLERGELPNGAATYRLTPSGERMQIVIQAERTGA